MKRKALGQHYLVDEAVALDMVAAARISPGERVLEVGTGRGALTKYLVGLSDSYDGYEVDRANYEQTLAVTGASRARVHLEDAFGRGRRFDVLVASLPYSQSSRFVEWLAVLEFRRAVVLLQEDFVRKVTAPPGSRDYRGVSALAQTAFEVRVISRVSRASFSPRPKVASLLVSISQKVRLSDSEVGGIKRLFTVRRKRVSTATATLGIKSKEDYGERRVYSLTPDEILSLLSASSR